ncbi:MAG TPA: type IV toxin-antitoxin system AbiEi family antitoxin domain-containing protein [Ilumatobacteraceae bacterium]
MPDRYRRLAADSTGQHGAFTRRQAAAAGIGNGELRDRVQSGLLETFGARTLRSTLGRPSALADLHAYVIDIGPPCWVSGPTASALHRYDGFTLKRPYHLIVPRGRNIQRAELRVHTSTVIEPIDSSTFDDLPVLSPVRTLIDIAAECDRAQLTRAIDSALRDGLISEDLLHRRIAALRQRGRYGIPRLLEALEGGEIARGGHSWLERRFLELLHEHGLPKPRTQQVLTRRKDQLVRVDFFFEASNLVVEVLGYRWHRTQAQMRADASRANALMLAGRRCLQFVYRDVVEEPDHVVATVRIALHNHGI